jgi:hypothetical protein
MSNGIASLDPDDPKKAAHPWRFSRSHPAGNLALPMNIRQLAADVIGKQFRERLGLESLGSLIGEREITEADLRPAELRALREAAVRAMGNQALGRASIGYRHYDTTDEDAYADVGSARMLSPLSVLDKLFDPNYSMKTTIGQGNLERDPDTGEYYVYDQYNFNERRPEPTPLIGTDERPGAMRIFGGRMAQSGAYGLPRAFGSAYGSPEGEGSRVRINLGDLEDALARGRGENVNPLRKGLSYLAGLLRREPEIPDAPLRIADPLNPLID